MKKFGLCLALILSLCLFADAGSGRSSGSFSSSRSSSSSRSYSSPSRSYSSPSRSSGSWSSKSSSSPSRSSSWGSSKSSSSSSKNTWGTSKSVSPTSNNAWSSTPKTSSSFWSSSSSSKATASDNNVYSKAKQSGLAFTSKTAAIDHFKTQNASKYTTKFTSEPKAKPSYIPTSTTVGGKTVNVTYNQTNGGYGYIHPVTGAWMMYDVMSDMVMMNMLMSNHGYYIGTTPVQTVHQGSAFGAVLSFVIVLFTGFVLYMFISNSFAWNFSKRTGVRK